MKVRDIMSSPAVTVRENTPLLEVAKLMVARRIGGVPVVRADGKMVGIVTESDFSAKERGVPFSLLRLPHLFGHWLSKDNLERVYDKARDLTASEVMTHDVVTVDEDDAVEAAVKKMCDEHVHRLPVVRGGIPIGMVARHDLLGVMVRGSPDSLARPKPPATVTPRAAPRFG